MTSNWNPSFIAGVNAASDQIRALQAENEGLRETIAEWQEIHGTMTGDVHRACQAEIERLRAALTDAIDLAEEGWAYAGDYFREKWDVEARLRVLKQDGEPQAGDEQAGLQVDLAQDQKDDVEQQDDQSEQRPKPRTRQRVSGHVLH